MNNDTLNSEILSEILEGYSVLTYSKKTFYFKHFSILSLLKLEGSERKDIDDSVRAGIKTEEELLNHAIKIGSWSTKREEELKSSRWMLKRSENALNKIEDPTQRRIFNEQIEGQRTALEKIQGERAKITSFSAEHLAQNKKLKKMVHTALFCDLDFKKSPPEEDMPPLTAILFSKFNSLQSRDNILRASYFGGFFDIFAAQAGNPLALFGVSYKGLTCFQKNLIVLSNALLNKLKNVTIPDEVSGDPVKIFEYEEREEGVDKKASHGLEDLKLKKQARGGKLKAEDFLS